MIVTSGNLSRIEGLLARREAMDGALRSIVTPTPDLARRAAAAADLAAELIVRLEGPALPLPWPYVMVWKPSTRRAKLVEALLTHLRRA